MQLVTIKALAKLSHGYLLNEGEENEENVVVNLEEGEVGQVPAEDAKSLHDRGLVKVAVSDADALNTPPADEQPTQTPEETQE
jgi:hypothetical protein